MINKENVAKVNERINYLFNEGKNSCIVIVVLSFSWYRPKRLYFHYFLSLHYIVTLMFLYDKINLYYSSNQAIYYLLNMADNFIPDNFFLPPLYIIRVCINVLNL